MIGLEPEFDLLWHTTNHRPKHSDNTQKQPQQKILNEGMLSSSITPADLPFPFFTRPCFFQVCLWINALLASSVIILIFETGYHTSMWHFPAPMSCNAPAVLQQQPPAEGQIRNQNSQISLSAYLPRVKYRAAEHSTKKVLRRTVPVSELFPFE